MNFLRMASAVLKEATLGQLSMKMITSIRMCSAREEVRVASSGLRTICTSATDGGLHSASGAKHEPGS